ncbi:MAG: hypothetical protein LBB14_02830 [Puniceicoccales bacterium]|jgi:hypothetical protein|nr:hypothetical protein [Puniceicoccales bacterium]
METISHFSPSVSQLTDAARNYAQWMADNGATFMPALKISTQEQFIRSFIETANHFPCCHRLNDCEPCALISYIAAEYPPAYLQIVYFLATGQEFQLTTAEAGGANVHSQTITAAAKFPDMLTVIDFHYESRLVGLAVMSLLEARMKKWAAAGYFFYQGIQESIFLMFSRTVYLRMERRDDGLLFSNLSKSFFREDVWENTLRLRRSEPFDCRKLMATLIRKCGFAEDMAMAIVAKATNAIVKLYEHSKTPEGAPHIIYATRKNVTEYRCTTSVVSLLGPNADRDALVGAKFFVVFPGVYSLLHKELSDFSTQLGWDPKYVGTIVRMSQIEIANGLPYSHIVPGENRNDAYVSGLFYKNDDPLRLWNCTNLSNLLRGVGLHDSDAVRASLAEIKKHIPDPRRGCLFLASTAQDADNPGKGGHMSLAYVQIPTNENVSIVYSNGVILADTDEFKLKLPPQVVAGTRFGPVLTSLSFVDGKLRNDRSQFFAFFRNSGKTIATMKGNHLLKYCSLANDLELIVPFASVAVAPTTFVAVPAPLPAADGEKAEAAESKASLPCARPTRAVKRT